MIIQNVEMQTIIRLMKLRRFFWNITWFEGRFVKTISWNQLVSKLLS